jgi:hypothetical protein
LPREPEGPSKPPAEGKLVDRAAMAPRAARPRPPTGPPVAAAGASGRVGESAPTEVLRELKEAALVCWWGVGVVCGGEGSRGGKVVCACVCVCVCVCERRGEDEPLSGGERKRGRREGEGWSGTH